MAPPRTRHGKKFQITVGLDEDQIEYIEKRVEQDDRNMTYIVRRAVDLLMETEPLEEPCKAKAS